MGDDGSMQLQGFPENMVVSLGIMEAAKLGVIKHITEQAGKQVQLAAGPLPSSPFAR